MIDPLSPDCAVILGSHNLGYKASSASRYKRKRHIDLHIVPDEIGSIPLARLRYAHIQDWVDRKAAGDPEDDVPGLAYSTVRSMVTIWTS